MTILAVASESFELKPWLRRCQLPEKSNIPLPYAMRVQWRGVTLVAVANGPGPRLAKDALEKSGPFDALVSIGLCGGLAPGLQLFQICSASEVSDGKSAWPATPVPNSTPARLLSVDRFLADPAEKGSFHQQRFDIVEMEAAPLAQFAHAKGIPFYAIKVVSDLASEAFQLDFNQCRDAAGRFDRRKIALAAMRHPLRFAPDLFRLATRGPAASEILGEFLAHARL